jgi:MFS family permease
VQKHELDKIQQRTVRVLASGQVLGGFGLGSTLSIGALLAASLSGSTAWSGAAATFSTLGAATWAIPLSRLAFAKGRRYALAAGAGLAISGALLVITAAAIKFFPLLIVGLFVLGAGSASSLQARFAAVDLPNAKTRHLSLVVWATTVGAVVGPNLFGPGQIVGNFLHMPPMTGPFLFTMCAQLAATTVFWFGLRPDPQKLAQQLDAEKSSKARPKVSFKSALSTLRMYPWAAFAILSVGFSHLVMVSVMSMTPVHMESMGYDLVVVGFTISLHIAGMYAFSPVFGYLADKLGNLTVILIGQGILISALALAGFGQNDRTMVTVALFLLGLGWSAATVSGSALLSKTLPPNEKANVQGLSDSFMNLSGALGGGLAGGILTLTSFAGLAATDLFPVAVIVTAGAIFWARGRKPKN